MMVQIFLKEGSGSTYYGVDMSVFISVIKESKFLQSAVPAAGPERCPRLPVRVLPGSAHQQHGHSREHGEDEVASAPPLQAGLGGSGIIYNPELTFHVVPIQVKPSSTCREKKRKIIENCIYCC
jgi:hypothetical protein